MRLRHILYILATVALGPGAAAASEAQVTGTVTYLDGAMLPPGAVLSVALQDISVADAPAEVVAAVTQAVEGSPPYPFALAYDPAEIQERHTYSVRARVTLDDQLIMVTDTVAQVITRGAPTEVELIMRRVAGRRGEDRPERRDADAALPMRGMFRYEAGTATFRECLTGRSYPVAMEGAYGDAERAYRSLESVERGAPVFAVLEGRLTERPAMEGAGRTHLVIDRFSRFAPGETCERNMADASLTNTYWKILKIADVDVHVIEGRREPHMILRTGASPDFTATVGCNKIRDAYDTQGANLSFDDKVARTTMACPPPLDAWESALMQVLTDVATWQVNANTLELLDAEGTVVLMAEAVYLR